MSSTDTTTPVRPRNGRAGKRSTPEDIAFARSTVRSDADSLIAFVTHLRDSALAAYDAEEHAREIMEDQVAAMEGITAAFVTLREEMSKTPPNLPVGMLLDSGQELENARAAIATRIDEFNARHVRAKKEGRQEMESAMRHVLSDLKAPVPAPEPAPEDPAADEPEITVNSETTTVDEPPVPGFLTRGKGLYGRAD